jgi:hypothetical protein
MIVIWSPAKNDNMRKFTGVEPVHDGVDRTRPAVVTELVTCSCLLSVCCRWRGLNQSEVHFVAHGRQLRHWSDGLRKKRVDGRCNHHAAYLVTGLSEIEPQPAHILEYLAHDTHPKMFPS